MPQISTRPLPPGLYLASISLIGSRRSTRSKTFRKRPRSLFLETSLGGLHKKAPTPSRDPIACPIAQESCKRRGPKCTSEYEKTAVAVKHADTRTTQCEERGAREELSVKLGPQLNSVTRQRIRETWCKAQEERKEVGTLSDTTAEKKRAAQFLEGQRKSLNDTHACCLRDGTRAAELGFPPLRPFKELHPTSSSKRHSSPESRISGVCEPRPWIQNKTARSNAVRDARGERATKIKGNDSVVTACASNASVPQALV